MRLVSKILFLLTLALELFCYWGLSTESGVKAFDEMDGLIPFFAGVRGAISGLCGTILWWLARRRGM